MTAPRRRALAATTVTCALALGGLVAVPAANAADAAAAAAAAAAAVAPAPAAGTFLAPYWVELDLTDDRQVTADDLEVLSSALGATSASSAWGQVSVADTDADGVITVSDVAALSQRIVYDDGPFEIVEASVVEMQAAMNAGVTTSVELTQDYLDRIAAYDTAKVDPASTGRPLRSIITTSGVALAAAAEADATRASDGMTDMLLGVPIAVKDNYDTVDMPTTGGCGCWDGNQTSTDAAMVAGLRASGAVILAKASLDEFAFGFASEFSSYQPAGTSTLVASPYVTSQTAGGSSGGTGAAIAANLAGIGFGTDTGGSIRIPSSYNQLVGVRPTVGLASRDGIIPLALSQDTGGPIARSVTDAAVALDSVTGVDAADPVTAEQQGLVPESYTSFLDADALAGTRIGYVTSMVSTNPTTSRLFAEALVTLQAQGATIVPIATPPAGFAAVLAESSGSTNEFKHDLDAYVAKHLAPNVEARSLQGVLASGKFVPSRAGTYRSRDAVTEATYQGWAGPSGTHTTAIANGHTLVTAMLDAQDLDTLIYPSGNPYSSFSTNMRLSPNTGMPAVTVPMGQATAADGTITGAGVNLEFLGRDYAEGDLLGLAYAFEQATAGTPQGRTSPSLYGPLPAG
ncbi:amidase family protein [Frigoribacterium sp. PvP032]|uniref:amidase family protein n=1 Tax=Frigoribacterium sp. PvP032 TaxID=2806589 RepID=UPI001B5F0944|nr:amidase family protein [Frigoribacterium sp. PvP032]MBP1189578.1 Asp-tRNA(Asn)/Glu-tRNA(Gln) amidotransferase A subunit family amidase [Frigoribacterium sp. PvP032]